MQCKNLTLSLSLSLSCFKCSKCKLSTCCGISYKCVFIGYQVCVFIQSIHAGENHTYYTHKCNMYIYTYIFIIMYIFFLFIYTSLSYLPPLIFLMLQPEPELTLTGDPCSNSQVDGLGEILLSKLDVKSWGIQPTRLPSQTNPIIIEMHYLPQSSSIFKISL